MSGDEDVKQIGQAIQAAMVAYGYARIESSDSSGEANSKGRAVKKLTSDLRRIDPHAFGSLSDSRAEQVLREHVRDATKLVAAKAFASPFEDPSDRKEAQEGASIRAIELTIEQVGADNTEPVEAALRAAALDERGK